MMTAPARYIIIALLPENIPACKGEETTGSEEGEDAEMSGTVSGVETTEGVSGIDHAGGGASCETMELAAVGVDNCVTAEVSFRSNMLTGFEEVEIFSAAEMSLVTYLLTRGVEAFVKDDVFRIKASFRDAPKFSPATYVAIHSAFVKSASRVSYYDPLRFFASSAERIEAVGGIKKHPSILNIQFSGDMMQQLFSRAADCDKTVRDFVEARPGSKGDGFTVTIKPFALHGVAGAGKGFGFDGVGSIGKRFNEIEYLNDGE